MIDKFKNLVLKLSSKEGFALVIINVLVIGVLGLFYYTSINSDGKVLGIDACNQSAIEGRIFEDANQNGLRDANEKLISKITINVLLGSGNSFTIKDPGANDKDASNDGYYSFCINNNELARIHFTDFSKEYHPGPRGKDSNTNVVFITGNGLQKVNFGLAKNSDSYQIIDIGNRIWNDTNGDGVQNVGEPGIKGVKLDLLDQEQGGKKIASVITDESGRYQFTCNIHPLNNPYGKYTIIVNNSNFNTGGALEGLKTTKKNQANTSLDSNANESLVKDIKIDVDLSKEKCIGCNFDFDIGFIEKNPSVITPTQPKIVNREPDYFKCDADLDRLAVYSGELNSNIQSNIQEYSLKIPNKYEVVVHGYAKEGLPEYGCPSGELICQEKEKGESFNININSSKVIEYLDRGEDTHKWSEIKSSILLLNPGVNKIVINHIGSSNQINSVGYKLSVCGKKVIDVTPTSSQTITQTITPSASITSSLISSITPTSILTLTPTTTSVPANASTPTVSQSPTSTSGSILGGFITTIPSSRSSAPSPTTGSVAGMTSTGTVLSSSITPSGQGGVLGAGSTLDPDVQGVNTTTLPNTGILDDSIFYLGIALVTLASLIIFIAKKNQRISLRKLKA